MKKIYMLAFALTATVATSLSGCGNINETVNDNTLENSTISSSVSDDEKQENKTDNITPLSGNVTADNSEDTTYTKRDLEQTADTSNAKTISVTDGETISITSEGVYVISGTAEDCTIKVDADENAKVQLVLDGVNISNSNFPAIYIVSADKVFITTTDSENTLSVSGQFIADGDTNTDAVIFSKEDLVLNGTGTLNIISNYANGISCKDDMKVTGGTYNMQTALDSFEANDSISVSDGVFNITTNKDGFHCENSEAEGTIIISGGTFNINGKSDGIQACALLQIDGGTMDISASEGLEATYILINDGDINIYATDDGINASTGTNTYETAIEINGGYLNVEVGQGDTDALDANGSIYVNGGKINVTAQMSSFDYDRTAEFNGGTIIINGTEVSEIPQSMMGGGMAGGMRGGMGPGRGGRF